MNFSSETLNAIESISLMDSEYENLLIDYMTNRAIQEFCKFNQYYTFDSHAHLSLRNIYTELLANIKSKKDLIDSISNNHYEKLRNWLLQTNSFSEMIYNSKGEMIEPVACAEYSAELQINVLQINMELLIEPVLDIGCGKQGSLVHFLRQKGIETYGFDRFAQKSSFISISDWFEFNFECNKWGTIISNLGFSNHFQHHHFRNNGNFVGYAKKYMEILNSLKIGGNFHYAPDLPFIEKFLDKEKYLITKYNIENLHFYSTKITKMK